MNVLLIGPPGSGKGTQGERLAPARPRALAAGDLLRAEVEARHPLGSGSARSWTTGELVPDR